MKSLWREGKLQEVVRGGGWQPPRGVAGSTRHVWTASAMDLMKVLDIYSGCFATVVPSECPNYQEVLTYCTACSELIAFFLLPTEKPIG